MSGSNEGPGAHAPGDHLPGAHVLVGVDLAVDCTAALRWAWQQAREEGRELLVVTVWEYPRVPPAVGGVTLDGFPSPGERLVQVESALAAAVVAAGLPPEAPSTSWTPPVHLHAVRPHGIAALTAGAGLLVLPGETHDGDTDYLTGSLRRRLAAACTCPVALVTGTGTGEPAVLGLRAEHRAELTGG
ncbi:hypothetical protein NUM3379_01970 [Kineococcus sp. NUM-3379]